MDKANEKYLSLAKQAVEAAAGVGVGNVDYRWIYSQWCHESAGFSSALAESNNNLGGICQAEPNDTPQPDGNQYYIQFDSLEDYARYFGRYLRYFKDSDIDKATTLREYIEALKNSPSGMYFGDDLEAYYSDCAAILDSTDFEED